MVFQVFSTPRDNKLKNKTMKNTKKNVLNNQNNQNSNSAVRSNDDSGGGGYNSAKNLNPYTLNPQPLKPQTQTKSNPRSNLFPFNAATRLGPGCLPLLHKDQSQP